MRAQLCTLALLVLALAATAGAAPVAQSGGLLVQQAERPSWYVDAAERGTLHVAAYPSSISALLWYYTNRYSFATDNIWFTALLGSRVSGQYCSQDGDSYSWLFSASHGAGNYVRDMFWIYVSSPGTLSFYVFIFSGSISCSTGSSAAYYGFRHVSVFLNNTQVFYYDTGSAMYSTGWQLVQASVQPGAYKLSISYTVTSSVTINIFLDNFSGPLRSASTHSVSLTISYATVDSTYARVTGTATVSPPSGAQSWSLAGVSPTPASYTASTSGSSLTITAWYRQTQPLQSGVVQLPKPSGYTVLAYLARAPQGLVIVTNSTYPDYLDEAYAPGSAVALQVSFARPSWSAVLTLAGRYTLNVLNATATSIGSATLPPGRYMIHAVRADPADRCFLKLNTTLLYSAALLNNTVLAPPAEAMPIAFAVQDFGAGYNVLQALDLQGRIAASVTIGATRQAVANLTPYAAYVIQVCKPGVCKAVGLVPVSSQSIPLTVMPSLPEVQPPSWASATYDYSLGALRLNVSCAAPPCQVTISKYVLWYNHWRSRVRVSLQQGWNLVFLRKASAPSASGMWAYVDAADWSEIRFGDEGANFLPHSIIWSNETHAQVLVYAPEANVYYLYWQPAVPVPDESVSHPFFACVNSVCGLRFNGIDQYARSWSARNWFPGGAGTIAADILFFSNDTVSYRTFSASSFTVLSGQLVYDSSLGTNVLYVPAGAPRYAAEVDLGKPGGGAFSLAVWARGSASASGAVRVEVYEDGALLGSFTTDVLSVYAWRGAPTSWMAREGRRYTARIFVSGTVDVYIWYVEFMVRRGGVGVLENFYLAPEKGWSRFFAKRPDGGWEDFQFAYTFPRGERAGYAGVVNSTGRYYYVNGQLVSSRAVGGLYSATGYFYVGYAASFYYFYGLVLRVLAYSRSLTAAEASSVTSGGAPPAGGLVLWLEAKPEYVYDANWDGRVDWLDLSGSGNHVSLYNFHGTGSFAGPVERQHQRALLIQTTCAMPLCSYIIYQDDPVFEVRVVDGAGRTATAYTGASLPLWRSPLGALAEELGRRMNLDAWGVNVNDFLIVLLGLGIVYAAFTYRSWELAVLALGAWLSIGTFLLGGSGRLLYPGVSLLAFGAALHYILRREKEM